MRMVRVLGFLLCFLVGFSFFSGGSDAQVDLNLEDLFNRIELSNEKEGEFSVQKDKFSDQLQPLEMQLERIQDQLDKKENEWNMVLKSFLTKDLQKKLSRELKTEADNYAKRVLKFLPNYTKFLTTFAEAKTVVVLEGLPRNEKAVLQKGEKDLKKLEIGGFKFFKKPLNPNTVDFQWLRATLMNHQFIVPHQGKFCGEFHPDIAILFEDQKKKKHSILICLGCAEVRWIGPEKTIDFDLTRDGHSFADRFAKASFYRRDWKMRSKPGGVF